MKNTNDSFEPQFNAGPSAMVYKTRGDYRTLVPVLLSADKAKIVSYPHPSDIKTTNGFSKPTVLNEGYLLDNRGIGKNVAFLKITYEEYSNLKSVPPQDELYNSILDKDPLTELCDCGNKNAYKNLVPQLREFIDKGLLRKKCKILK